MSDDTDQRLTTLEMAVTHQEQTIHELSEVITRQWEVIDALKRDLSRLEATKADIDPEEEADRRPPHY
jgi:SlyX protein